MKKTIIHTLAFLFTFSFYTSSFALTEKIIISDSSQMNLNKINKLSSVVDSGGAIPIGTIIVWPYRVLPPDTNCKYPEEGGRGRNGVCRWLDCNGQTVDPNIYPEFAVMAKTTPRMFYATSGSFKKFYGFHNNVDVRNYEHREIEIYSDFELDIAENDSAKLSDGLDGLYGLQIGSDYDQSAYDTKNKVVPGHHIYSVGSGTVDTNLFSTNTSSARFLVRVSN